MFSNFINELSVFIGNVYFFIPFNSHSHLILSKITYSVPMFFLCR